MWTKAQSDAWLVQRGASYVTTKDGVEWWRLPNRNWVSRKSLASGYVEMREAPCGC
jgi:hypothetical protein